MSIEVKLSSTPRSALAHGIRRLQADLGDRVTTGFLVHPGDVRLPLEPGVSALPYAEL